MIKHLFKQKNKFSPQKELYNHYQAHRFGVNYKENIRETVWIPIDEKNNKNQNDVLYNCPGKLEGIDERGELIGEYKGKNWNVKLKK